MKNMTVPSHNAVTDVKTLTSQGMNLMVKRLVTRYPFIHAETIGRSALGAPIWLLKLGRGQNRVLFNAAHHANEWITSLILVQFLENYARAVSDGTDIGGLDARALFTQTRLLAVPLVNPDGVDLVNGALEGTAAFTRAAEIASRFPDVPFPSGWKANVNGVDLNLQYPAGWDMARENKRALGVDCPAPRDFPGIAPLSEPESRALYELTRRADFARTLSYHTQGKVIYWKYLDIDVKNAYKTAKIFGALSGYTVEETPVESGYAGYKDWFIDEFRRPGFTVEAGEGVSPLPLSELSSIYRENSALLSHALLAEI